MLIRMRQVVFGSCIYHGSGMHHYSTLCLLLERVKIVVAVQERMGWVRRGQDVRSTCLRMDDQRCHS
jgi:hypothetical protein